VRAKDLGAGSGKERRRMTETSIGERTMEGSRQPVPQISHLNSEVEGQGIIPSRRRKQVKRGAEERKPKNTFSKLGNKKTGRRRIGEEKGVKSGAQMQTDKADTDRRRLVWESKSLRGGGIGGKKFQGKGIP